MMQETGDVQSKRQDSFVSYMTNGFGKDQQLQPHISTLAAFLMQQ